MRICLVTNELLGAFKNGGIGTSTTFLAMALARNGHEVEIHYFGQSRSLDDPWDTRLADQGIQITYLTLPEPRPRPDYLTISMAIFEYLKPKRFDAVIFQDTSAPGYCSIRAKQTGLAFEETLLIHLSHSPTAWINEANLRLPIARWELAADAMERLSAELADVVVSPSAYMLKWMTEAGWRLPTETAVIPYFSAGTVEPNWVDARRGELPDSDVSEIVFFGRLEERKGIHIFLEALCRTDPEILNGRTIKFLGKEATWTKGRIKRALPDRVRGALAGLEFRTSLAHEHALAELTRNGSLAVIPSLTDNSPCVIYECMERGVKFLTSSTGGGSELFSASTPGSVLFDPEPESLSQAITKAIREPSSVPAVVSSFGRAELQRAWTEVLETDPTHPMLVRDPDVTVVVGQMASANALQKTLDALAEQSYPKLDVVVASRETFTSSEAGDPPTSAQQPSARFVEPRCRVGEALNDGWRSSSSELIVFLEGGEVPHDHFVTTLVDAWRRSGADIVTCGLKLRPEQEVNSRNNAETPWLFIGEPGELGLVENQFGATASLWTRGALTATGGFRALDDLLVTVWEHLVRATLSGLRVASVPEPLVVHQSSKPGRLRTMSYGQLLEDIGDSDRRALVDAYAGELPQRLRFLAGFAHVQYTQRKARRELVREVPAPTGLPGVVPTTKRLARSFQRVATDQGVRSALEKSLAWLRRGS